MDVVDMSQSRFGPVFFRRNAGADSAEREAGVGHQQRGLLEFDPGACRSSWSVLAWQGGGEKAGEQLVDALGLVVMDPVRGVGQALDAGQVGHVVVVRLG